MATITGSTTVNWSTIPFDPVNFQADIALTNFRLTQALTAFGNEQFSVISASPTFISVNLFSGGNLQLSGFSFDFNPVITGVEFFHPNGQIFQMSCVIDEFGSDTISSMLFTRGGVTTSVVGNFVLSFEGVFLGGSVTQLSVTSNSYVSTISGALTVNGAGDISGTITNLSIQGPGGNITMTGLSLPYDATLASVTNASQLLSVIGGQMAGNDTVTYTNNSGTGLTFLSGAGNDSITVGGPHGDTLNGGAGTDTLTGGLGSDSYVFDGTVDSFIEAPDEGTDTVLASVTYSLPDTSANIENVTLTGSAAVSATGNSGQNVLTGNSAGNVLNGLGDNDTLLGGLGNDQLIGDAGADSLDGGGGNDTYFVDDDGDTVTESIAAGGIDLVNSARESFTLGTNVENLVLLGAALNGTGNTLNNVITGNAENNVVSGDAGNDSLLGLGGNDNLNGGVGADALNGGDGNDQLQGDAGKDALVGGAGDDTYFVDGISALTYDTVTETALVGSGTDIVNFGGTGTYILSLNVENLVLLEAAGNVNGTGNALINQLTGNSGNNVLDGGLGNDTMTGGDGNDTYKYDRNFSDPNPALRDVVQENPGIGGGIDTAIFSFNNLGTAISIFTGEGVLEVENVTVTGTGLYNIEDNTGGAADNNVFVGNASVNWLQGRQGNDSLVGNAGNDTLDGGDGNDTLDGGVGTDSMTGGFGNDTFTLSAVSDLVIEAFEGGADTVRIGYSNASTAAITINLASAYGGFVENLQIVGSGLFNLTGNGEGNQLTGNAFANVIDGGGGADAMDGGAGNDTYFVDDDGDTVTESIAAGGIDLVNSARESFTLGANVDRLTLTGSALAGTGNTLNNVITGNAENNVLSGDAGNDSLLGLGGNDGLDGGVGADALNGGDGNDNLDGGTGKDALVGGMGDDTFVVDGVSALTYDTVTETALVGSGTDTVNFGGTGTYNLPLNVENLVLLEAAGNVNGTGNALINQLTGNSGNNVLDGGAGSDTMTGGDGNDTYKLDTNPTQPGSDVVVEAFGTGAGIDTAVVAFNNAGPVITLYAGELGLPGVENITVTGTGLYNLSSGEAIGAALIGNASVNVLTGGIGDDTLVGGAGNDTLLGNQANDSLDGGVGVDSMTGGDGNDTYTLNVAADIVTELDAEGSDTVKIGYSNASTAAITINLASAYGGWVEHLQILGTGLFNLTGNDEWNQLTGNASANVLDGGVGDDTMAGGAGNDTYKVDSETDQVNETISGAAGGVDLVQSTAASYTLTANVERLTLMGGALNGTGNNLANLITGNELNNTLDGGTGKDAYVGGLGDDTFIVDGVSAVTYDTITDAGGTDTVHFGGTGTYVMPLPVDNLLLLEAAGNANGTGTQFENQMTGNGSNNALSGMGANDALIGNGGNDTLDGGVGVDSMTGGLGNDLFILDVAVDSVTENAAEGSDTVRLTYAGGAVIPTPVDLGTDYGGNIENAQVTGAGLWNLTGNAEANALTGNATNNLLTGLAGNDALDGGAGNDTMTGGTEDDTYTVNATGDVVTELDGEGSDTVKIAYGNVSTTIATLIDLNSAYGGFVENLQILGAGLFNLTGNAENNILTGNASANIIDGGTGDDAMAGGGGNDLYKVDSEDDTVTETLSGAAGGVDTVHSTAANFALDANVENLVLMGAALNGTGNILANAITGNAENNILDGGAGKDVLNGGLGNDTFVVDGISAATYDTVIDTGGTDTVNFGGTGTYTLGATIENLLLLGTGNINGTGNGLANQLTGNSGNNILNGAAGNDTMTGGDGNDFYILDSALDLVAELLNEGTDTVRLAYAGLNIGFTPIDLGAAYGGHVENVQVTGTGQWEITGNAADNVFTGNAENNILWGRDGNDTLVGGAGGDTLMGEGGNDRLDAGGGSGFNSVTGGSGADEFLFSAFPTFGNTSITDFTSGEDKVLLDNDIFTGLPVGALNPAAFKAVVNFSDPIDASDRIIYVSGSGSLYFDANGSAGGMNYVAFAVLIGQPTVTASDFLVID